VLNNDPRALWVASCDAAFEDGSYENPFGSVAMAVERAQPGQIVVLKPGTYSGDVTIQKSGLIDKPIRILAQQGALVECIASCWFFYDVSDVICSGIVFRNSPGMALSVIGKCMRNRFEFMRFINCSTEKENACTMYFGGSGQACNTVESCSFERTGQSVASGEAQRGAPIGLMIAEGDFREGEANRDCVISKNIFSGYGCGIIVGCQDSTSGEYGHKVVYNTIENCSLEGIVVKCGDSLVKGNVIRACGRHSISVAAGTGSTIEDNRIVDCHNGIRVAGKAHSIVNNCIIRCREDGLAIMSAPSPESSGASNILIEHNTLVGWGEDRDKDSCGVRIDPDTTCVVRKNLFHGRGRPYCVEGIKKHAAPGNGETAGGGRFLITDNISSGQCDSVEGCMQAEVAFRSAAFDNYINDCGYGAAGWMLSPEAFDPGPEIIVDAAEPPVRCGDEGHDHSEPWIHEDNTSAKSLFFGDENGLTPITGDEADIHSDEEEPES
jgi:hypothetical protein